MTQPVSTRIAACVMTGLLASGVAPLTSSTPALAAESPALRVTIDSITPAAIPAAGEVTVSGQITNQSDGTWTDLNVYLLTSAAPFTTSEELVEAQRTDPATQIGDRLTAPELYDTIGDLVPGESVDYILSVPRDDLEVAGEAGVYWLGVHVLGADEEGRDSVADGRSRTLIPLMERGGPITSMALVMPFKAGVRRDPEGRLKNIGNWQQLLAPGGRLRRLLKLSSTSGKIPLTWVLDPAVADAATSVALGNPPMSTAPDGSGEADPGTPDENPSPSPSGETTEGASGSPSESAVEDPPAEQDSPGQSAAARQAADWLSAFRRQSERHKVLTVPYGDLDVASTLRYDFRDLLARATELSKKTMDALDVETNPVVAPETGLLPRDVPPKLDPSTPVLLSEAAAPDATGPVVETDRGLRIALSDGVVPSGGPPSTRPGSALVLRQRILSEAAVHALSPDQTQPLVVSTPQLWDPGGRWRLSDFFRGLHAPWLRAVDLPTVLETAVPPDSSAGGQDVELHYPRAEARAELPIANLLATQELDETGKVFANLLTQNRTVDEFLAKSAMLASTYRSRDHRQSSAALARATTTGVKSQMKQVRVDGPSFVTMSSEEGTFAITLVNDLDEPVTIGVEAETGSSELVIPSPDLVSLGPGQRASVRLRATSTEIGLHSVSLAPTNSNGQSLGSATTFNVRSSQAGLVIWVIMGLAAAVLFLASGIRITKRVRARKATHGPRLRGARQ